MKIIDLLRNVEIRDTYSDSVMLNTLELEPKDFNLMLKWLVGQQCIEDESEFFEKTVAKENVAEFIENEISCVALVVWAYFWNEGYVINYDDDSTIPSEYVDEYEYEIIFKDVECSIRIETSIDTE